MCDLAQCISSLEFQLCPSSFLIELYFFLPFPHPQMLHYFKLFLLSFKRAVFVCLDLRLIRYKRRQSVVLLQGIVCVSTTDRCHVISLQLAGILAASITFKLVVRAVSCFKFIPKLISFVGTLQWNTTQLQQLNRKFRSCRRALRLPTTSLSSVDVIE